MTTNRASQVLSDLLGASGQPDACSLAAASGGICHRHHGLKALHRAPHPHQSTWRDAVNCGARVLIVPGCAARWSVSSRVVGLDYVRRLGTHNVQRYPGQRGVMTSFVRPTKDTWLMKSSGGISLGAWVIEASDWNSAGSVTNGRLESRIGAGILRWQFGRYV
jgi:hypothetical protein